MRSERLVQAKRRCHLVSRMARRIVCLMGVAALTCAGTEGPADEMEAAWIAQDGPIPTNMTHAAWRAEKLARRAERLKPVVAMSKTWAYCRHYVLGRYPGDVGWYNQTGGSFHMLNPQTCVYVGEEGVGHLRVGGTGYFSTPHLSMGRSASIHVAGEAKLGFFGENLSAAHVALAGKVTWATGSALLIDTRNGPVRISGGDLLGASVVEKTGANDLVLTSSPVGVCEIRVREGNLRTSEPDIIPPAIKVLSLGGQFSKAPTTEELRK